MTVTYLAGKQLKGLSTDNLPNGLQEGSMMLETDTAKLDFIKGGWKELARTTLGSAGDDIDVTGLANKRYYQILCSDLPTGDTQWTTPVGNTTFDTGTNYTTRESYDGGADSTVLNTTSLRWNTSVTTTYNTPKFGVGYISNYSTKEKLAIFHGIAQNTAGAGTAPQRAENASKWTNTSNVIDRFRLNNIGTGSFDTGSEVVVLGYDPADVHTTNFWEELASVNGAGTSTITSGTITAKKYLWVQLYTKTTGATASTQLRFNSDSGANYARRYSDNGGADGTTLNAVSCDTLGGDATGCFYNYFIINVSANEKLVIMHRVRQNTAGAGNAPNREEDVYKWVNTATQITEISITKSPDTYDTASILKVWGSN